MREAISGRTCRPATYLLTVLGSAPARTAISRSRAAGNLAGLASRLVFFMCAGQMKARATEPRSDILPREIVSGFLRAANFSFDFEV